MTTETHLADTLLGLDGMHLRAVTRLAPGPQHRAGLLQLLIETAINVEACTSCGVLARGHGRIEHRLADAPCFGAPVQLIWRKRRWRCAEQRCPMTTWSEQRPDLPARSRLTTRAVAWAVRTLRWDDSTVSAIARQLGVDWHTLMDAIRTHAADNLDAAPACAARLADVDTLGVDEHIWRPSARHRDRAVTSIVDLTRDDHSQIRRATLGRRGHRDDPLYRIRRLLITARESLTDRGRARRKAALQAGDPGLEVTVAWHAH